MYNTKNNIMRNLLTYKTISDSRFDIRFNAKTLVEVEMDAVEAHILVDSINEFIHDFSKGGNIVEVKVGDSDISLIVDIWQDFRYDDLVESAIFYFEDFVLV